MKNALLLFAILFIGSMVFSQENIKKYGNNFQHLSFEVLNLTESNKQLILDEFKNTEHFKDIEIVNNKSFSGYIHKDYINKTYSFFKDNGIKISALPENNYSKSTNISTKPLSSDEGSQKIVIPENMKPKYVDTGNPEEDKKRYTEAKKKLLEEHPEFIQK